MCLHSTKYVYADVGNTICLVVIRCFSLLFQITFSDSVGVRYLFEKNEENPIRMKFYAKGIA